MRRLVITSIGVCGVLAPVPASAAGDETQAFHDAWDAMLQIDTLTYVKVVESNIPNLASGATVQTGTYQLSTQMGIGTFVVEPGKAVDELLEMPIPGNDDSTYEEVMDLVGGQQFEVRLVDGVFWQGIPQPEGLTWIGAAVDDMPLPPTAAFDGVALLDGAFSSDVLTIVGQSVTDDGGTDWNVSVDADLIGTLGAQSGTNQRLLDAGFDGETGGRTQVLVHVDAAGVVTHVNADLSDWWVDAVSEVDAHAEEILADIDVLLDVRFAIPDKPLEVVAPCTDPTTETRDGIETLVCPIA